MPIYFYEVLVICLPHITDIQESSNVLLSARCIMMSSVYFEPIRMYPDVFESATFSLWIQKLSRPHLEYLSLIRLSTRFRWYPDSL